MPFALVFCLIATLALLLAWFLKSFVVAWVGVVSLFVALAYVCKAPQWIGKRTDGRLPPHAWPLWVPYLGIVYACKPHIVIALDARSGGPHRG